MKCIDFLSESPKLFIFEKEANKTNFGGILMLIDIIIMILISIYYSLDYANTPNFAIQYKQYINPFEDNEKRKINENDKLRNPEIEFYCNVFKRGTKLYDSKTDTFIDEKIIKRKVSDFSKIEILAKCKNENCSLTPDKGYGITARIEYYCKYESFYIDDQSAVSPLKKRYDEIRHEFSINIYHDYIYDRWNWHNIIYKEKNGFGKEENIYASGFIEEYYTTEKKEERFEIIDVNQTAYRFLGFISIENKHKIEDEYIRKAKSPLDFIASAISYFPNVYSILKFIFRFYSKNFNNYKTIEKIISKNKTPNISFSISNINNSKLEEININNSSTSSENNNELLDKNNQISENDDDFKLKKLRFIHFFFNNIYCNCCTKIDAQELINICNKILSKYVSYDSILYNQILLENLFKDYKWNNPELNNIYCNELIMELKNHIT